MRKIGILLFLVGMGLLLSGCAAMIAQSCTNSSAYSSGLNDGQNGRDMQANYASLCPAGTHRRINSAYRRGYNNGIRHRKPRSRPWPSQHPHRYY